LRAGQQIAQQAGLDLSPRTRREVEALFAGLELVEPGLVWVPQWRPESPDDLYVDQPEMSGVYAGVGHKP
jgi:hypothetical protein